MVFFFFVVLLGLLVSEGVFFVVLFVFFSWLYWVYWVIGGFIGEKIGGFIW